MVAHHNLGGGNQYKCGFRWRSTVLMNDSSYLHSGISGRIAAADKPDYDPYHDLAIVLRRMTFLSQTTPFIGAWGNTLIEATMGFLPGSV